MEIISGITQIVNVIFYFLMTGYFIYLGIQLLTHGQVVILILLILFGFGLISTVLNLIILPFSAIPSFFLIKLEKIDYTEESSSAEILDEKGRVVEKLETDMTIKRRFGKYLLISLVTNLASLLLYKYKYNPSPIEYITLPIFWTISNSILIAIPITIYNLIRYRKIFGKGWYQSLINILRIEIIITILMPVLGILALLFVK